MSRGLKRPMKPSKKDADTDPTPEPANEGARFDFKRAPNWTKNAEAQKGSGGNRASAPCREGARQGSATMSAARM